MPMMYEQFCIRSVAVKEKKKDENVITIDKDDMYNGMGIVRAIPGPVFSIATFAGGMALKDMGQTPGERTGMQLLGCLIGTISIFLPSALLVLFFFPIWSYLKKYAAVYRSIEGINAAVVGILIARYSLHHERHFNHTGKDCKLYKCCNYFRYISITELHKNSIAYYCYALFRIRLFFIISFFFYFLSHHFRHQITNRFSFLNEPANFGRRNIQYWSI